jgi:hypothetical protein
VSSQTHALYAMVEDFLEDGEVAECTCGWESKRGTHRQAMAWLTNHIAEEGANSGPLMDPGASDAKAPFPDKSLESRT